MILKAAPRRGLLYKGYDYTNIECFSDTDLAGAKEDRRSALGYCVLVGCILIF